MDNEQTRCTLVLWKKRGLKKQELDYIYMILDDFPDAPPVIHVPLPQKLGPWLKKSLEEIIGEPPEEMTFHRCLSSANARGSPIVDYYEK